MWDLCADCEWCTFNRKVLRMGVLVLSSSTGQKKSNQEKESNISLIIQLIFITLSNFMCCFPVNGIYIATMFLSSYSLDLIIWSTVLGMPINALVIPFVLIILSLKNLNKVKEKGRK